MTNPDEPQVPITPGPAYEPPTQPQPYQSPPVQQPAPDPNAGIRTAGTFALWIWIVLTLIPIAVIVACIGLCLVGGIFGGAGSQSGR